MHCSVTKEDSATSLTPQPASSLEQLRKSLSFTFNVDNVMDASAGAGLDGHLIRLHARFTGFFRQIEPALYAISAVYLLWILLYSLASDKAWKVF